MVWWLFRKRRIGRLLFSPEADSFCILKQICVETEQREILNIFDEYEALLAEPPLSTNIETRQGQISESRRRLGDTYWDKTQELDLKFDENEPILSHIFVKHVSSLNL